MNKILEYIVARPTSGFLILGGLIFLLSVYAAQLTAKACTERWKGNVYRTKIVSMMITGCTAFMALLLYGISIMTIQIIAFSLICIYASYGDIKTREADDWLSVMVLLLGLAGRSMNDIPSMIFSLAVVGGIMLLIAVIGGNGALGGADIKFAAASAFLLGPQRAILGTIIGCIASILWTLIKKKGKTGIPMLPYLSIGYVLTFLLK